MRTQVRGAVQKKWLIYNNPPLIADLASAYIISPGTFKGTA